MDFSQIDPEFLNMSVTNNTVEDEPTELERELKEEHMIENFLYIHPKILDKSPNLRTKS